ncbi:magnesium transporter [Neisseria sp. Ec49-e6-T10]|uniref:magnesium transporter n=1 Tax=Neisseria sp. Ec49-e6-T10 TaxID=3140744 RepID=UPI003EC13047
MSALESNNLNRQQVDIGKIHELSEPLVPVFDDILLKKELTEEQNNKLNQLLLILKELHPADTAMVLESLPLQERILVWKLAEPEDDGEVLLEVSDAVRETLIESMGKNELLAAVEDLDADELAHLAPDLPREVIYETLDSLNEEERAQVTSALSYQEDQIGSLMDYELVNVRADVTCEVVLRYLRRFDVLPSHTDKIFVIDEHRILQGVLPIRKLLVSDPDALVSETMVQDVVRFYPTDDAEESALAFERYDLVSAPVIDNHGKLIGRITIDEMIDVIREESEIDILNMAGLKEEEDLFAPVINSVRNRWAWLAINLCTAFIASRVIGVFEGSIEKIVALAALMPIVAGIGGNSGNQTITMIVRALATGQMQATQAKRLWKKEVGVAIFNGLIWGSVMGVVSWLLYKNWALGAVMVSAMTLNLVLAATLGVLIPTTMAKLGKDPALGSSVLITAVTDSGGFFIFLGLASIFLL